MNLILYYVELIYNHCSYNVYAHVQGGPKK